LAWLGLAWLGLAWLGLAWLGLGELKCGVREFPVFGVTPAQWLVRIGF